MVAKRKSCKKTIRKSKGKWGFSRKGTGRTSFKGISHKGYKESIGKVQSIGRTSAKRKYVK